MPQLAPSYFSSPQHLLDTPSPRSPSCPTAFNSADEIERGLEKYGHRTWGFIIYRGTYTDDSSWTEFLSRVRGRMSARLFRHNGIDLLEKFTLTIREDPSRFDNVETATIREDFEMWATTAVNKEQGPQLRNNAMSRSPRYNFCIYADEESMKSVVGDAPPLKRLDIGKKGWVELIVRDYANSDTRQARVSVENRPMSLQTTTNWKKSKDAGKSMWAGLRSSTKM